MRSKPRGKPIIMLPGIGGFAESYFWNMVRFYKKGYWPIAVDHLGFGQSSKPSNLRYKAELFSYAITQLIEEHNLENVTLIGNSFGGGVALGVWDIYPEAISKLVLVSSAGFGSELNIAYRFASLPLINQVVVNLVINRYLPLNNGRKAWKSVVHRPSDLPSLFVILSDHYKDDHEVRRAYSFILRCMVTLRGQSKKFHHLTCAISKKIKNSGVPVLVIWGKEDPIIPNFHAKKAAELTGGRYIVFDKCGHMPYIEHATHFNKEVLKFLNE